MKKTILTTLVLFIFMIVSTRGFAQNRVVVVPLEVENSKSQFDLNRTKIVQGGGSILENGANLVDAVAYVKAKNPFIDDPWVIKLEPGIFSLPSGITLPQGVSLVGSGGSSSTFGGTLIGSSGEVATVTISNSSIISDLSVTNSFGGPSLTVMEGKNTIRDVASYTANSDIGVNILAGETRIENSIIAALSLTEPRVTALNIDLASVAIKDSRVSGSGSLDVVGISNSGLLTLNDSKVTGRITNDSSEIIDLIAEDRVVLSVFGSEIISASQQPAITQVFPASISLSHSKITVEGGGEPISLTANAATSKILCDALTVNDNGNRSFVGVGEGSDECSGR